MLITSTSFDPSRSFVACFTPPQTCCAESAASDVTCGWLSCSLHHLWALIHPLKRWNQTVSIIQKGEQVHVSPLQRSPAWFRVLLSRCIVAAQWKGFHQATRTFQCTAVTTKCLCVALYNHTSAEVADKATERELCVSKSGCRRGQTDIKTCQMMTNFFKGDFK